MHFHQFKFFRCQFTRLVQDFLIDPDFPDIMKSRSYCDQILIRPGQMILVGFLYQPFQEHTGQFVDMFHMQSTFTISKLYDLTQNTHHDPVVFLLLINLIRYQRDQSSLFCIQLDRIEYSLIDNLSIEWTADII